MCFTSNGQNTIIRRDKRLVEEEESYYCPPLPVAQADRCPSWR